MTLCICGLSVSICGTKILDDISLSVAGGERLAILGESGAGKSLLALGVMRLLPAGSTVEGRIAFQGRDLNSLTEAEMRRVRGKEIGMVFEQPWSSLNPVFSCGNQIADVVRLHHRVSAAAARSRATHLLHLVGVAPDRYGAFPHELSGGMQQRVAIAIALAGTPSLIIADEPGTALDRERQDHIAGLFADVVTETGAALVLITHQLGLAQALCARGAVLYAGQIVETGDMAKLLDRPQHPYTQMLVNAVSARGLHPIAGSAPEFGAMPAGCRFQTRCPCAESRCACAPAWDGVKRCWR